MDKGKREDQTPICEYLNSKWTAQNQTTKLPCYYWETFREMGNEKTFVALNKSDLSHGHWEYENSISTNCTPNKNNNEILNNFSLIICSKLKILWYVMPLFFLIPERKIKIYLNNSYLYNHIATGSILLFFLSPPK